MQDFLGQYNQANQQAQGYQNQLAQFQAQAKNPNDFYNQAANSLGVNEIQGQANTARNAVNQTNQLLANLPGAVQGQVNGTLTNESQHQRLLAQQQQPLTQNYQQQSSNYSDLANQYSQLQNQANQQANMGFQGQQSQYQNLQGLYGNASQQASGYLSAYQQQQAQQQQQAEADRQYQLQQQQLAAQKDAAARAAAPQPNPFASVLQALNKPQGQIGTAASTSPQQSLMADIQRIITPDYASRFLPGYTERQIQRLQQTYQDIDPNQVASAVYGYRKQFGG